MPTPPLLHVIQRSLPFQVDQRSPSEAHTLTQKSDRLHLQRRGSLPGGKSETKELGEGAGLTSRQRGAPAQPAPTGQRGRREVELGRVIGN